MAEDTSTQRHNDRRRSSWLDDVRAVPRRRPRLEQHLLHPPAARPAAQPAGELAGLAARLAAERERAEELEAELRELSARASHLLFVASPEGYGLRVANGPPPVAGARVDADGVGDRVYVVARVGPSPLPGDRRRCAYLEPA